MDKGHGYPKGYDNRACMSMTGYHEGVENPGITI